MPKQKNMVLTYLKNIYTSLAQIKKMLSPKSYEEGLKTLQEVQWSDLWEQQSYKTFNNGTSEADLAAEYVFHNKCINIDLNVFVNSNTRYISATRTTLFFEEHNNTKNR